MSEDVYDAAFLRLLNGNPRVVPIGTKISNDSVALEAGRGRGALKRSRASHARILRKIQEAKNSMARPAEQQSRKLQKQKAKTKTYRELYEDSLMRELNLMQKEFDREHGTE